MHSCSERKMIMKIIWSLCLIFFLSDSTLVFASPAKHLCRPDQKDALLEFKSEFHFNRTAAGQMTTTRRNSTDCCSWDGVSCDDSTGMVVELDLRYNADLSDMSLRLSGPLRDNSSLFRLQHLQSLLLTRNDISGVLPDSIGNLKYLSVLSLSFCNFVGKIPSSIGNLSYLTHLGLSYNSFHGSVPSSLFMIPSISYLVMRSNHFSGPLEIGNISSSPSKLERLYLGDNNFSGPIPGSVSKLLGLQLLELSFWNTEKGVVDFSIFLHLKSLKTLDLSYLNTRSMLDLSLFSHLMSLQSLRLSGNNLKIRSGLHLPSPIETLELSSCNISEFPKFLQNLTSLYSLDISINRIEGQVPEWLWSLPALQFVNISQNSFSGFQGSADVIQRNENVSLLDISSNNFQDLPLLPKYLYYFLGSENGFSGEIPRGLCELVYPVNLVLSNNNFNGSIPQCFENFGNTLSVLHLQNNSLSGVFPDELFNGSLRSLDVGHNRLSGVLPKSLINCTDLEFLNVEENRFSDTFPFWLRLLPNLQILVLRSNQFHGPISSPGDSLSFPKLRIFDISKNRFNGVLPSDYFAGLSAMSSSYLESQTRFYVEYYHKSVGLTNKGLNMELVGSGFTMYKTIDVSGNRFQGHIPESIGLLKELIVLNMSNNAFTGHIPSSLGHLTSLESLDLSQNRLSGIIPPELGKLTFLERMNFSYNRLEGPIPQGTQIQSQNTSSFAENPGLCGAPLQETCGRKEKEEATKQEEDEEEEEEDEAFSWIAAAIAYVPGVFCGLTIGHILASYKPDWFVRIFHSFT